VHEGSLTDGVGSMVGSISEQSRFETEVTVEVMDSNSGDDGWDEKSVKENY